MAIKVSEKKKETKLPKGVDLLFQFAVLLFVLVGGSYFFMMYLNAEAKEEKKEIEQAIVAKRAEIPEKEKLEEKARGYFNLIEDFKLVVENNRVLSPFFGPFEKMIHPNVSVFEMSVNLGEGEGVITGSGRDLVTVGQQFHALKNSDFISNVDLTDLTVPEDDRISFSFSVKFSEELFKLQLKEDD